MSPLAAFAWGVGAGMFTTGFGVLVAAHAAADFLNRRKQEGP